MIKNDGQNDKKKKKRLLKHLLRTMGGTLLCVES